MAARIPANVTKTGRRRTIYIPVGGRGSGKTWLGENLKKIHFAYLNVDVHVDVLKAVNVKLERCRKHLYVDGHVDYELRKKLVYIATKRGMKVVIIYFDLSREDRVKNCCDALSRGEDVDKYSNEDDIALKFSLDADVCLLDEERCVSDSYSCIVVRTPEEVCGLRLKINEAAKRQK